MYTYSPYPLPVVVAIVDVVVVARLAGRCCRRSLHESECINCFLILDLVFIGCVGVVFIVLLLLVLVLV